VIAASKLGDSKCVTFNDGQIVFKNINLFKKAIGSKFRIAVNVSMLTLVILIFQTLYN
jgi:hypothetical protein